MTEPERLLESSTNPTTRELLRVGLKDTPRPDALGRVALALGLTAGAVAVAVPASAAAVNGALGGTLTAVGKASGSSGLVLGKWLLSGLAVGAVVSGTATVVERSRAPAMTTESSSAPLARRDAPTHVRRVAQPAPIVDAPAPEPEPSAGVAAFALRGAASSVSSGPEPSASGMSRALGAEAARIDAARRALAGGDVSRAMTELDWYERSRVVGVLDREAELLRIQALVKASERPRAVELARAYLSRHPHDAYAARLQRLISSRGATF